MPLAYADVLARLLHRAFNSMALFWLFMRDIMHRLARRDRLLKETESFDAGGFRCDRWDYQCRLSQVAQTKIPALFHLRHLCDLPS